MGCTVVAALFSAEKVIIAHAGDSRFYEFFRTGSEHPLRQLTADHRPEGYENLCKQDIFRHTSLISRSLGTTKHPEIELQEIPRRKNARYLLCSDGLYNHLPQQLITGLLGSDLTPRQITGELIRSALLAGEKDNITVICAAESNEDK